MQHDDDDDDDDTTPLASSARPSCERWVVFFFNTLTKYYTRFLSFFVRRKSQLSVCSCRLLTKAACQQFACRGLSGLLDTTVVQSGGTASAAISNNRRSRTPSLWEVTLTSFCTSRCEAGGLRLSLLHCFKDKRRRLNCRFVHSFTDYKRDVRRIDIVCINAYITCGTCLCANTCSVMRRK